MIIIHTDGSSIGNPGPGGYGIMLRYGIHCKKIKKGFRLTTNNRMELWGVIAGVEAIKKENQFIKVCSDSRYVVDALNKSWLDKWVLNDFKGKKNSDLWQKLWKLKNMHQISFQWIKGHSGEVDNEICHQLAIDAAKNGPYDIDYGYEQTV